MGFTSDDLVYSTIYTFPWLCLLLLGIWFKDVFVANLICGGFYTSCDQL